jgi:hypothetical protein
MLLILMKGARRRPQPVRNRIPNVVKHLLLHLTNSRQRDVCLCMRLWNNAEICSALPVLNQQ